MRRHGRKVIALRVSDALLKEIDQAVKDEAGACRYQHRVNRTSWIRDAIKQRLQTVKRPRIAPTEEE